MRGWVRLCWSPRTVVNVAARGFVHDTVLCRAMRSLSAVRTCTAHISAAALRPTCRSREEIHRRDMATMKAQLGESAARPILFPRYSCHRDAVAVVSQRRPWSR